MNFEVIRATVENAQAMGYIHSCSWQKAYRNIIPEYIINSFTAEHPRFLLQFCINRLEEFGYQQIPIWVLEENKRACWFYEKNGFIFDGRIQEIEIGKP